MSTEALTHERGRFYVGPNGFPRFAGSATGVYLADTVRSQVSPIEHPSTNPAIDDAFMNRNNDVEPRKDEVSSYTHFTLRASDLKSHEKIRQCIETYFRLWHPLFPFLDGAYIIDSFDNAVALAQLDEAVSMSLGSEPSTAPQLRANRPAFDGLKEEEGLILSAIIKAVVSIGAMGLSEQEKLGLPLLFSTTQVTMLGHFIVGASENSSVSDLLAVQALLGIELYLYLSRSMRPAMHLSGVLAKLAFEAGLHRCPERYTTTFTQPADRQLRKRVFYSLYVLDRILTAEFGVPIMLHDSDVDTCVPGGIERHSGGDSTPDHPARTPTDSLREMSVPGRTPKRRRVGGDAFVSTASECVPTPAQDISSIGDERRLLTLYSLVGVARLGGRAMEVFNKSIHHRALSTDETLRLRTDLESWWNGMSLEPEDDEENAPPDPRSRYPTLFTCLYHQHIMSLCRPALSLSPARMEHAHALETAVTSARTICNHLHRALSSPNQFELFWPGYVDMVFFAALILVHSGNRQKYREGGELNRSKTALNRAGKILERLSERWPNLGSFKKVIQTLTASPPPTQHTAEPYSSDAGHNSGIVTVDPLSMGASGWTGDLNGNAVDNLFTTDFSFDFESFGINPDSLWAFQQSIPGSPNFP